MSADTRRLSNNLGHGYFKVDMAIVWKTVEADLPHLHRQVQAILDSLP
ncbi:HepT-like ribonuclease domain-containing protein [Rhodoblastus sp.]